MPSRTCENCGAPLNLLGDCEHCQPRRAPIQTAEATSTTYAESLASKLYGFPSFLIAMFYLLFTLAGFYELSVGEEALFLILRIVFGGTFAWVCYEIKNYALATFTVFALTLTAFRLIMLF